MKYYILCLILVYQFCHVQAQTLKTVDSLEGLYQSCLDKGVAMLDCSVRFYDQMDSLLNVVYNKLCARFSLKQQTDLKMKQRLWLKKRDEYFRQIARENEELRGGDAAMIKADKRAQFVRSRVIELIKQNR